MLVPRLSLLILFKIDGALTLGGGPVSLNLGSFSGSSGIRFRKDFAEIPMRASTACRSLVQ